MTGMPDRGPQTACRCLTGLICCLLLLTGGCGRKAPPRPPAAEPLPVVAGLAAKRVQASGLLQPPSVALTWTLMPLSDRMGKDAGFALYRDALPISAGACPSCPPRYELVAQVPYTPAAPRVDAGFRFQHIDTVVAGYRYRYQVALRLADGRQADPSETVEVIIDGN